MMDKFPVPEVLECMQFVLQCSKKNQRTVRDYEFDLYLGGERDIYLDGVPYHISEGCLVFRKPGQQIIGFGDYNMYLLTLDFSHNADNRSQNYHRSSDTPQQPLCSLDLLDKIPTVFIPERQKALRELYEKISQCSPPNLVNTELQEEYVMEFLFLVFADAYKYNRQRTENMATGNSYVKKACNYINEHYNEALSVDDIATHLSLNKNYLIRLFKMELNKTPHQYILEMRLLRSRSILIQSDYSIQQVAQLCGFNTPSYFIKSFKKRFGKTPNTYRSDQIYLV